MQNFLAYDDHYRHRAGDYPKTVQLCLFLVGRNYIAVVYLVLFYGYRHRVSGKAAYGDGFVYEFISEAVQSGTG